MSDLDYRGSQADIAIIGMSGRFPQARNINEFWSNLREGRESISHFSVEDVIAEQIAPEVVRQSNYVRARAILSDIDLIDASFFGLQPKEAALMDPQQRLLLECSWEALEEAGYDPKTYDNPIGVFVGTGFNYYLQNNLFSNPEMIRSMGSFQTLIGNDRDHVATLISYKLNLRGPSMTVQTACSTSLVAVHVACQSLLSGECSMALAGGVTVILPRRSGYLYQEGGIMSRDGHCRPFDVRATGTVAGSGAGIVLLKLLSEALADGDLIRAVIKGSAINNDGAMKVGYTAPSVEGQAAVIAEAQAMAGVSADSISYIEAHGTATTLGDPIEIAALTQAFRSQTSERQFCAIGSVKSNIGHLDTAAGVAGLIKTVLALEHEELPASLHYEEPNPEIDFAQSPFYVNAKLREWKRQAGKSRRAGVSSFGIGGTNAHVIVEEAPPANHQEETAKQLEGWQLLVLSARSPGSLAAAKDRLATHLEGHPEQALSDVAYTLQMRRRAFPQRAAVVCSSLAEAVASLRSEEPGLCVSGEQLTSSRVIFMFPGQGAQYINMGRELYEAGGVFRDHLSECVALARPRLGLDLLELLYPEDDQGEAAKQRLLETELTQVAIFAVEYALAQQLQQWGIKPAAMIGHSLGEYVAACLSGVFTLETAVALVIERGRLMQQLPRGVLLAVSLGAEELQAAITAISSGSPARLWVTAINGPQRTVAGGAEPAIARLERYLESREVHTRRLQTSHAFHSGMVDPVLETFGRIVEETIKGELRVPYVSNLSGAWAQNEEARSSQYWMRHMREPVNFAAGIRTLTAAGSWVWLEVGPGRILSGLVKQQLPAADKTRNDAPPRDPHQIVSTLGQGNEELKHLLRGVAQLWCYGLSVDWNQLQDWTTNAAIGDREVREQNTPATMSLRRRRVRLPTYAFDRQRLWVEHVRRNNDHVPDIWSQSLTPESAKNSSAVKQKTEANGRQGFARQTLPASATRRETIIAELKALVANCSGLEPSALDNHASFFDLGFDSLLLIQISQSITNKLKVSIAFRLLIEDYPTIHALAEYLDQRLPADVFREETQPEDSRVALSPIESRFGNRPQTFAESASSLITEAQERLRQIENTYLADGDPQAEVIGNLTTLMSQQLKILQGVLSADSKQPAAAPDSLPAPTLHEQIRVEESPQSPGRQANAPEPGPTPDTSETAPAGPSPAGQQVAGASFGPWRPVARPIADSLTPTQQKYLDAFVARYTARTSKSKALAQTYRSLLADTRVSAGFRQLWKEIVYPIVGRRSAGSRIWDEDGNEYIDLTMGFGVNLFGHAPSFVSDALQAQLQSGIQIGPQSHLAGEVAELFSDLTGTERVTFCNTGSEAVMAALRLARTVTGRTRIALFAGSYHGIADEVLVRGQNLNGEPRALPVALGIPSQNLREVLVLPYDRAESLNILHDRMHTLAAVLVEPVQSSRPEVQPGKFLHELRRLTEQAGTALVFDEMITGFRIHPGGAQAWFGVQADLATYGKIVGGGIPIGVVAGKARFMDAVDGGAWRYGDDSYPTANQTFFAGTFCKHPLAMAAAKAVLSHLKHSGPELQSRLNHRTSQLMNTLTATFDELQVPLRMGHFGSLFRFRMAKELSYANLFVFHLLEKGIFIGDRTGFLSTAHSDEDLAAIVKAVNETLVEMREGGFLPGWPPTSPDNGEHKDLHFNYGGGNEFVPAAAAAASYSAPVTEAGQPQVGASISRTLPLTDAQKGLLALMKTGDDAFRAYNETLTLRVRGALDVSAVSRAFQNVVDRHEALRSVFSLEHDQQRILSHIQVNVPFIDFSMLSEHERENSVAAFLEEEAERAFDLERGPIVSLRIAKLDEQEHLMSLGTHHIACDGLSFDLIVSELRACYSTARRNLPCSLQPPAQISEYVAWQSGIQSEAKMYESSRYWLTQFSDGVPKVELFLDHPRPALQTHSGRLEHRVLDKSVLGSLKKVAARHNCTMFTLLFAAFAVLIHRLSGQADIVIGAPAAGQSLMGEHNLIGYCINTLPIRSRISNNLVFGDYLKSIRRRVLDAYEHQNYSFYRMVKDLKLRRDPSRHPLVSISFNMDRVGAKLKMDGLELEIIENPKVFATFDLSWNVVETAEKLYVECVYNSDLFDASRSKGWMAAYELLLQRIAEHRETTMRELLGILDDAARKNKAAREKAFRNNRQETLRSIRRKAAN